MQKIYLAVFILLLLPLTSAATSYTFQKDKPTDLKVSCFDINSTLCSSTTNCFLTTHYPNLTNLVTNGSMTFNNDYYNYTFPPLKQSGIYSVITRCEGPTNGFSTFTFEVTPTGLSQTSILDNPVILIFVFMALALIGMGVYLSSAWFGFLGAIMFILGGIYTMIYGFNNVTDLYSQGIGITFIGLGFIFMFTAAYEWLRSSGGDDD